MAEYIFCAFIFVVASTLVGFVAAMILIMVLSFVIKLVVEIADLAAGGVSVLFQMISQEARDR